MGLCKGATIKKWSIWKVDCLRWKFIKDFVKPKPKAKAKGKGKYNLVEFEM